MLKQKRSRQTWWPLYALTLMMVGLLFLTYRLAPSPGWRIFLEVGDVIVGYGLIAFWLETHSIELLDRPSAEANDSPAVKSPQLEISPSPLSSHIRGQFYVGSDPTIIYGKPEDPIGDPRLNGHHRARTTLSTPEETAE